MNVEKRENAADSIRTRRLNEPFAPVMLLWVSDGK
jgi:hypothetical protein